MMTVEMTAAEQQQYLRHDDDSKFRLTPLSVMSNGSEEDIALIQNRRKIGGKAARKGSTA